MQEHTYYPTLDQLPPGQYHIDSEKRAWSYLRRSGTICCHTMDPTKFSRTIWSESDLRECHFEPALEAWKALLGQKDSDTGSVTFDTRGFHIETEHGSRAFLYTDLLYYNEKSKSLAVKDRHNEGYNMSGSHTSTKCLYEVTPPIGWTDAEYSRFITSKVLSNLRDLA